MSRTTWPWSPQRSDIEAATRRVNGPSPRPRHIDLGRARTDGGRTVCPHTQQTEVSVVVPLHAIQWKPQVMKTNRMWSYEWASVCLFMILVGRRNLRLCRGLEKNTVLSRAKTLLGSDQTKKWRKPDFHLFLLFYFPNEGVSRSLNYAHHPYCHLFDSTPAVENDEKVL